MQKNSDTNPLDALPDEAWKAIMEDTAPPGFTFNEQAQTLDELLTDDVALSLLAIDDDVLQQKYKLRMRDIAKKNGFASSFDKQMRAYERQAAATEKEAQQAERAEREAQRDHTIRLTGAPLEGLTCYHWTVTNHGIEGFNGRICSHPILIAERLNNLDTGTQKVKLSWPRFKRWHSLSVKRSVIASRNTIVSLADHAIAVNSDNAPELVRYLADFEADNENVIPVKNSLDRVGWVNGNMFMPYSQECVYDGDEEYQGLFCAVCIVWGCSYPTLGGFCHCPFLLVRFILIGNEGLSLLENLGLMGVKYPAFLQKALESLRQKGDEGNADH